MNKTVFDDAKWNDANWKLLVDQTRAASSGADRTDLVQGNSVSGRFGRVIIIESPPKQTAALAELEISGTPVAP